jgi:hypothetical protein
VVWCGVVWSGLVRCGVVWCGVAWAVEKGRCASAQSVSLDAFETTVLENAAAEKDGKGEVTCV